MGNRRKLGHKMINVFKATCYRIRKSRILVYAILCSAMFGIVIPLMAFSETEFVMESVCGVIDKTFFFIPLIILVFIEVCNCGDFGNKTIYYEIMHGHKRSEIYAGRTLSFLLFTEIIFHIQLGLTFGVLSFLPNYTLLIDTFPQIILKLFCLQLFYISFVMFFVACSFICRNMIASLSISWFGIIAVMLTQFFDKYIRIDENNISNYIGFSVPEYLILERFSNTHFALCSLFSFALIAVFYCIGYAVFSKTDMQ